MGGINPYQEQVETPLPDKSYSVTFMPMGKKVSVDPAALPLSREGRPGSILDIADGHGIEIDHACGGVCACSTCHVIVREGFESIPEASESEEDMLDEAPGVELTSRLACQAVPSGAADVVVEIPGWNRNHARESH
ncbi:MAG: 2Fe-2S iron-sulfur cluster binding domain-containing protein [Planctomycetes bacterium]|nr:2Fe-2S iron-sulfur cluster binding domain-containing protein [Planctomycetota bacterium]